MRKCVGWLLLSLMFALLPACYHMRVETEAISIRTIIIPVKPQDTLEKIRVLIEEVWKCRILETVDGTTLITAPYHFTTDTGLGQPAGGRKYYTQLKIEILQKGSSSVVLISPYNFEIRTSYAYNDYSRGGAVGTLYKHYPYEEYPGMFDLSLINKEMDRVSADILRIFQENIGSDLTH